LSVGEVEKLRRGKPESYNEGCFKKKCPGSEKRIKNY